MDESSIIRQFIVLLINATGIALIITISISRVKPVLKLIFAGMTILMFIWVDFAYFARITDISEFALLSIRIAWAITPLLFILIYSFLVHFFDVSKKYQIGTYIFYALGLIYLYLTLFTNLFIQNITYFNGNLKIVYGNYIWFFFGIVGLFTAVCFILLIRMYRRPHISKDTKKRTRYLMLGMSFFFGMNAIFNISLPVFFSIVDQYEFGDYSTIFFLAIIAYTTVRHSLFGGRVVFTTFITSYLGSFLLANTIILSRTMEQRILSAGGFLLFMPIGYLLVRSILKEIQYREQVEHMNKALEKSKQRYLNLAREQKDIIDVMGHEIRTPLTAIIQELNLHKHVTLPKKDDFLNGNVSKEELHSALEMIFETLETTDKASTQASFLVNDMLETARLDKKSFSLDYSKFDLVDVIKSSVDVMEKTLDPELATIAFHTRMQKLPIEADETRIREAVYALLSNAIKYGRDPNKQKSHIDVEVKKKGTHAYVTIQDDGIGIAQEDIAKLGKKFVRLNPYMSGNVKRPGGTGLGLFVIKGIMEHHKGEMLIESDGIGKGSRFILVIPLYKQ
jgi:signal transduction histidine kinase